MEMAESFHLHFDVYSCNNFCCLLSPVTVNCVHKPEFTVGFQSYSKHVETKTNKIHC